MHKVPALTKYGGAFTKEHRLVVHHIDGDRSNNALDNLTVLCHNHHSDRHAKKINDKTVFDCHYINEDYI